MRIATLLNRTLALVLMLLMLSPVFGQRIEYNFPDAWGNNGFNLTRHDNSGVRVVHSITHLSLFDFETDGNLMKSIEMEGVTLPGQEGAPDLPGNGRYIAIPQGASATLKVNAVRKEIVENIDLLPSSNIPIASDDSPLRYEKDMSIYGRNAFYPAEPFSLSELTTIRGVDMVMLGITPFQYNPVTKQLIIYHDIDVEVNFKGGNGQYGDNRLRNRWWDPILKDMILNSDALPEIDYSARYNNMLENRTTGYDYIVVVPNDPVFIAWGDSIREFRNRQGIRTQVVTTADVGGNNHVQIKNYISNAYNNWDIAPAAVLLLADYGTSGSTITSETRNDHPYGPAYVSDVYFGDMNNDHLPDITLARITARNAADLQIMVPKFLNYERTPPTNTNFYNVPITAMGWQTERWFQLCSEIVNGFWEYELGKQPLRQNNIYSGSPGTSWSSNANTSIIVNYFGPSGLNYIPATPAHLNNFGWGANATTINQAINAGAYMIMHRDHGYEYGWGEPDYGNTHLSGLNNDDLTHVFSINCLTGKFNISGECFAEAFHRHQKGALSITAASETSYSFVNDVYVWGLMDNLWPGFMPAYGTTPPSRDILPAFGNTAGKYFLQQSNWPYNPGDKQITYYLFHHHGDAFSTVYTEIPQQLTVNHMPVLLSGLDVFEVTANHGALIGLTVNGELIGVGEGTGMPVSIPIPPQIPGNNLLVTITLQNYYRYEAVLEIIPPDGPYVIYTQSVINDAQGNNNGLIDYGESIVLDMSLKNVGLDPAVNVMATLSTTSQYVTITDNSHAFGTIQPDEIVSMQNAFAFDVSDEIPDNLIIPFVVTMTSGTETWESNFSLMAYAPSFAIGNLTISDPSGNNNGQADPGETIELIIPTLNDGHSQATNVSGAITCSSPYVTINVGQVNFETLDPNQTENAEFTITIADDAPIGTPITINYNVGSGVYTANKSFVIKVGLIIEDFETGDFSSFTWMSGGVQPWTITNTGAFEGTYAAKSGAISHSQSTQLILEYDVGANDTISFYRKVSSENNYDFLKFYINNTVVAQWSGTQEWSRVAFPVTQGFKTFKWEYMKDGSSSSGSDCAWIDYIVFPTPAACPSPRNLQVVSTSSNTALLNWSPGGTEDEWDLIWGPKGFNPATSGTLVSSITEVPYLLTGLQAITQYDFYVRSYCDPSTTSAWNGPVTIQTQCDTFTLPFTEAFGGPSVSCWSFPDGQGNWGFGSSYTPPSGSAPNAFFGWSPSITNYSHSLVSPLMSATGFTDIKLDFKLYINNYSTSTVEQITVEYKAFNDTEWTLVENFTNSGGTASFNRTNLPLDGMAAQLFQVRFRAHGANSYNINGWGLDDVVVHGTEAPSVLPGDANCDGIVNVLDGITIVNFVTGEDPQPFCFDNADVTEDGVVNLLDFIATINIVVNGKKTSPYRVNSETAHIYLNNNGIELRSDGTLAGLQFEISGLNADILKFLPKGLEYATSMKDNKLLCMIFSFDNTPIPAGKIQLFSFEKETTETAWISVLAGNLNAEEVKVIKHIEGNADLFAGEYMLNAYPNPSQGQFRIEAYIPCASETIIKITDIMGREVIRVYEGYLQEGRYTYDINSDMSNGIYFLTVQASPNNEAETVIIKRQKLVVAN